MNIEGSNLTPDPATTEGLSSRELSLAYWIATHKEQLKKVALWTWGAVDALLIIIAVVGAVQFVIGSKQDERRAAELTSLDATFSDVRDLPQPLQVQSVERALTGDGKVDAVAVVQNPNTAWGVTRMSYYFTLAGVPQPIQDGFALPLSERTFVAFDMPASGEVGFVIGDVQWVRVGANDVRDHGIETENPQIVRPASNLPSRLQFLARNTSVVGYWNVEFLAKGYAGDRLAGVGKVSAGPLEFGKEVLVDVPLSGNLANASRFIIEPQVNIFDESVFMPVVTDGSGEIK